MVKVVIRTRTSALRAREVVSQVFAGDLGRIRVSYVFDPGSAFNGWVKDWAAEEKIYVQSWAEGMREPHDLVITASENIPFSELTCPAAVLGHGLGFNKLIPATTGDGVTVSGLVKESALRTGNVKLFVTHSAQIAQLRSVMPAIEEHAVVTSDSSLAILRASQAPRHVARYRRQLRTGNRTLVLIMSTWGDGSVMGSNSTLPERLLAELPTDQYQVALVAHCNVWDRDGPGAFLWRLDDSLRAGLVVVEPKFWHAALAAADLAIGDHGSLSLYAAMIGKPLMLGAHGAGEVVPGTPMDELIHRTPQLDMTQPLRPQLDNAIATYDPGSAADLMRAVVENPDDNGKTTRDQLYALLGIKPGRDLADVCAAPPPKRITREVHAFKVRSVCSERRLVTLERTAHLTTPGCVEADEDEFHRVVSVAESNPRAYANASIVLGDNEDPAWLDSFDHPGCLLAAAPDGEGRWTVLACPAGGQRFRVARMHGTLPSALLPSVLYTLLVANQPLTGPIDVQAGDLSDQVMITQL